jgi:hypothetical protein
MFVFIKKAFKDRKLGFDATQISWHTQGEYLLIAGSNKQCGIYTNEGIKLSTLAEKISWVLCAKHKPNSNFIVSLNQNIKIPNASKSKSFILICLLRLSDVKMVR